jgi:hypothetical protein
VRRARGEHELDGQRRRVVQTLGDVLARHSLRQPVTRDLDATPEAGERVAGDDRRPALDAGYSSPSQYSTVGPGLASMIGSPAVLVA